MARPGAKFRASVSEIEQAIIKRRGNVTAVAKALGVDRRTIYRRIEKSPRLRDALDEAREEQKDYVEYKFNQLIDNGYWPAIRFFLVTQARDRGYIEQLPQIASNADIETLKRLLAAFSVEASVDDIINQLIDIENRK